MLNTFKSLEDRYEFVKADTSGVSKENLCHILGISRSAYYAWVKRMESGYESKRCLEDKAISRELVRLHQKYPTLGLDPLHQMLKPTFGVSRKRVHRLKSKLNIRSIRYKAYKRTTNSNHNNPISPNLIGRKFKATAPNQAWVSDITYIPTAEGWLYFAAVKDLFTKKVVGYAMSERINTQLCLDALNMAIYRQRPPQGLIFHSDRGVQYTSAAFRYSLNYNGFNQSMSRKGDVYDNAVAENFFSCLKCECVHLQHFATRAAAKLAIFNYIESFYNRVRPHSGIGWLSPTAFERGLTEGLLSVKIAS
jgi:transposase InsO family protein